MNLQAELTWQSYEDSYNQAIAVLRDSYALVSSPYLTPHGKRICDVEGLAADDHMVLLLAWGPELAEQIEDQWNPECAEPSHPKGAGREGHGDIDQDWISGFLTRWILAEQFLALERTEGLREEHAVQVLIKRDIPALLSELARSRPDLNFRAAT
jgi:hypothetical protein